MIQSFLVRLRIFSRKNWEAIESLFELYTRHIDIIFRQSRTEERFFHIFDIMGAMLETLRLYDPREKDEVRRMAFRVMEQLIRVMTQLERNSPEFWHTNIIKTSLELVIATSEC